ncbi:MAG: PaaI family thioesterase [Proteobacteria bacterium]|nr:PaaI family thioesterase [Pseudomonadota bacterium]
MSEVGVVPMEELRKLSGLELMHGLIAGKYPPPPIMRALDFTLDRVEHGVAVFSGDAKYDHYNPIGSVHGGWIATLLDSCMGCAMHTTLKPGQGYTSLEIKVNFVRAVLDTTGRVTAEGRVLYAGSRTGTAEGKLLDANGKLLAHGTTTCLIFPI